MRFLRSEGNISLRCTIWAFKPWTSTLPNLMAPSVQRTPAQSLNVSRAAVYLPCFRTRLTKVAKWYRSTFFNALILGLCNFCAPGLWGAMNSLGAGGEEKPYLVKSVQTPMSRARLLLKLSKCRERSDLRFDGRELLLWQCSCSTHRHQVDHDHRHHGIRSLRSRSVYKQPLRQ